MPKYIYRSAKTGRIVTEKWAKKHPATTVRENAKHKSCVKGKLVLHEVSVKRSTKRKFPIREEVFYVSIKFVGTGNTFDVKTEDVVKAIMDQSESIIL